MNTPMASPLRGMIKSPLNAWMRVGILIVPPIGTQPTGTTIAAPTDYLGWNETSTLTATVHMVDADSPIPTGSVSFYAVPPSWIGGTAQLLGTVSLAEGGSTAIWHVAKEFGDWGFYARYHGDTKWAASQSEHIGVMWMGNLMVSDFATALPTEAFGPNGYQGGRWGPVVIGNIGFSDLPWGPEWYAEAFCWGNPYASAHFYADLLCASTGPTVWQLNIGEQRGNSPSRWATYTLTRNSPIGTYTKTDGAESGGISTMPGSFSVSAY